MPISRINVLDMVMVYYGVRLNKSLDRRLTNRKLRLGWKRPGSYVLLSRNVSELQRYVPRP